MSFPQPPSSSLSSSSILDRVKLFLPVIKKANEDLDELIKKEGVDKVRIDNDLLSNSQNANKKIVVLDDNHDSNIKSNNETNTDSFNIVNDINENRDNDNDNDIDNNKMIQLEFALGNIKYYYYTILY